MPDPVLTRLLDAPSAWQWLDPSAARLTTLWRRLLPPGGITDMLHGKGIGHPAHPPLAQGVLSGWTGAALLAAGELRRRESTTSASRSRDALGLLGLASAVPAVIAGWADWTDLHEDQQRTGLVHAATMATAGTLSLAARLAHGRRSAAFDLAAGVVATAGGALGGHLAYRWAAGANHAEAFPHLAAERWSRVCRVDELVEGQPRLGTAGDEPVVVVKVGADVHALADRCSHLAGPLHEGTVDRVDGAACLVCPWHDSAFRLGDGSVARGPAYAAQPVLEVRVAYGWVDVRPCPLPGVAGR